MSESSARATKRALVDLESPLSSPSTSTTRSTSTPSRIIPTSKSSPFEDGTFKMKDDNFYAMQTIITFIRDLQREILNLKSDQQKLQASLDEVLSKLNAQSPPSFATVASRNLPREVAANQVIITRRAIQEEASAEARRNQLFLKGLPETSTSDKDTIYGLFADSMDPPQMPTEVFRLGKLRNSESPPRPIILTFASLLDALKFSKQFARVRSTLENGLRMSCRPNYCASDLEVYRKAWSEAIKLNNSAKKMEWTVRNLRLVKVSLETLPEWSVQERKSKTPPQIQPAATQPNPPAST